MMFELHGTVDAVVHDNLGCEGVGLGGAEGESVYALDLSDGVQSVRLRLELPLDHDIPSVGDTLNVEYASGQWGAFHEGPPPEGSLEIRDSEGGLVLWIGQSSHGPAALQPPAEVTVANGSMGCLWSAYPTCDTTRSSLRVRVRDDEVDVPHRSTAVAGDYLVVNQDNSTGCMSWDPTQVAVIRRAE